MPFNVNDTPSFITLSLSLLARDSAMRFDWHPPSFSTLTCALLMLHVKVGRIELPWSLSASLWHNFAVDSNFCALDLGFSSFLVSFDLLYFFISLSSFTFFFSGESQRNVICHFEQFIHLEENRNLHCSVRCVKNPHLVQPWRLLILRILSLGFS